MSYPRQLAYQKATFEGDYTILYAAYEAKQPGKWLGSYKLLKGSVVVDEKAVANPYDSERAAATNAHDLGVLAMEEHISKSHS
ncbi:hypothetical protein [Pseudoduganella violaceinigra]|uniref:hypothetical protein n=1 Tax=Pseudoduganella violaceinigra TaxID=246602 RepID=UPI0012B57B9C|nr:hypothetical protein [Pseudoduganella violaceinigra]